MQGGYGRAVAAADLGRDGSDSGARGVVNDDGVGSVGQCDGALRQLDVVVHIAVPWVRYLGGASCERDKWGKCQQRISWRHGTGASDSSATPCSSWWLARAFLTGSWGFRECHGPARVRAASVSSQEAWVETKTYAKDTISAGETAPLRVTSTLPAMVSCAAAPP